MVPPEPVLELAPTPSPSPPTDPPDEVPAPPVLDELMFPSPVPRGVGEGAEHPIAVVNVKSERLTSVVRIMGT